MGLRASASFQVYGYAEASPLVWSDPFGLCSCKDECPSGNWDYIGVNVQAAFFGGIAFTRGVFACQDDPVNVRQAVWSGCGVIGFLAGGGYEQSSGLVPSGCGCNRAELYGLSVSASASGGVAQGSASFCAPEGESGRLVGVGGLQVPTKVGAGVLFCKVMPR